MTRHFVVLTVLTGGSVLALGALAVAQGPSRLPPAWAYGVPPLAPGEVLSVGDGGAGSSGTPPPARGPAPAPDTSLKRVPGSSQAFTLSHIRDYFDVGDWFPEEHPAESNLILHGRAPHVRGCGMCHLPNGKGRPENAPLAGLPYAYVVQQLQDFKNDLRTSAEPRKTNTALMIEGAKDMTDEEVRAAAAYFSSMKWTGWIRVVETDVVPKTRLGGNVFLPIPGAGTEPIGNRIVESPEDTERFDLRDPHSGFVAYVPTGSLAKGAALVAGAGGKSTPCLICHGPDLMGLGPIPGIGGRSPSYLARQLYDIQAGTRRGAWSPLMKQVLTNLTADDILAIAAYAASRSPQTAVGR